MSWEIELTRPDAESARRSLERELSAHGFVQTPQGWRAPPFRSTKSRYACVGTLVFAPVGEGWKLSADLSGVDDALAVARRVAWGVGGMLGAALLLVSLLTDNRGALVFLVPLALVVSPLFFLRSLLEKKAASELHGLVAAVQNEAAT